LAQGFLLNAQEQVTTGLDGLAVDFERTGSMGPREKLRRHEGESDGQPDTENNQQDTSNLAIPAMTARPATPDYQLNFSQLHISRFRLILQLLPTFGVRFPGLWTERHFAALLRAG
jgi:hypothetical protein